MQSLKPEENQTATIKVEVFRTTVDSTGVAAQIITAIQRIFPIYKINFDLDDCDNILRIESSSGHVEVEQIMSMVRGFNQNIEVLQ